MATSEFLFTRRELEAALAASAGTQRAVWALRHGSMRVGLYAPCGEDLQGPHDQDELYIVASGAGVFVKNGEERAFAPQDVIFVEAGAAHRFTRFSADFAAFVIFWGPKGGEA
jgi:mannose-6-phosphate isomerase-like protein (cupin superfamily)